MADDAAQRALFGKLDAQLRNNQPKKALKTVEESECGPGGLEPSARELMGQAGKRVQTLPSTRPAYAPAPPAWPTAVLKSAPADADALRCKAALQIELDNFEDALRVASSPGVEQQLAFERVR